MDGIVSIAGNRSFASSFESSNNGRRESADASNESKQNSPPAVSPEQGSKVSESSRGESTVTLRAVGQASESFKATSEPRKEAFRSADTYSAPTKRDSQPVTEARSASSQAVTGTSSTAANIRDVSLERNIQESALESNGGNTTQETAAASKVKVISPPEQNASNGGVEAKAAYSVGVSLGSKGEATPLLQVSEEGVGVIGALGDIPQQAPIKEAPERSRGEESRASPEPASNRPQPEDLVGTNIDVTV